MAPFVDIIKWGSAALPIISEAGKLYQAIKNKDTAQDDRVSSKNEKQIEANKEIDKRSDRLIQIGHGFLPEHLKDTAEIPEVIKFKNDVMALVIAARTAFESFLPLLTK